MTTAGIDIGAHTTKVVIVRHSRILASSVLRVTMDREKSARDALEKALKSAGLQVADLDKITATGIGRRDIYWANDTVTEITAAAKGANYFFPAVRTVIDIGAEECRGVKVDGSGKVIAFVKNDKCAAGVGSFVESMAHALETTVEQMGILSLQSNTIVPMNVTCVVFAESEVVSLIHAKTPKTDIARAIHESMAIRITSMVRRVGVERELALIGGMAKNPGLVERLCDHLGLTPLVANDAQLVGAVGAALLGGSDV